MPSSNSSRRPSAIASFFRTTKDAVEIVLDGSEDSYINSYTTLDRINGQVHIKFDKPTEFDRVMIHFEGVTNTFVEKVASTAPTRGRSVAKHVFMRVPQPIDYDQLPPDNVFQAGETYTVPINFIVPENLLENVCNHRTTTRSSTIDTVKEEHLALPPSFGDQMVAGDGQTLLDDLAPEMARISYLIRVLICKRRANHPEKHFEIASKSQKLRIIPMREEKPPLTIPEDSDDYQLRKERDVKKGSFKLGKIGKIVAEAVQPRALVLPPPNEKSEAPVASTTTVNLRFDPTSATTMPPIMGSLSTRLKVQTYYGTSTFRDIPRKSLVDAWDMNRGSFVESIDISTRPVSALQWTKHQPDGRTEGPVPNDGRQGATSMESRHVPHPTAGYQPNLPFYTASILLPISLPHSSSPSNRKTFPPTFHSCLVSRVYVLDLNLTYHLPSKTVSKPSLQLKLPIQIASRGNPDARPNISEEEMESILARMRAMEELQADEYWQPRRLTFVEDGIEGDPLGTPRASIAVPEYTEIDGQDPASQSRDLSPGNSRQPRQASDSRPPDQTSSSSAPRQSHSNGSPLSSSRSTTSHQQRPAAQNGLPPVYNDIVPSDTGNVDAQPRMFQTVTMALANVSPFPGRRSSVYGYVDASHGSVGQITTEWSLA